MSISRSLPLRVVRRALAAASLLIVGESAAQGPPPATPPEPLPLKYAGPPTAADITAGDLMTRVYKFADDSMMGRAFGTEYNDKATAYIAGELKRLGLQPAGDSGTFFQKVPIVNRLLDSASTLTVDGTTYRAFEDFVAGGPGSPAALAGATVIYLGSVVDTVGIVPADSVRGKIAFVRLAALPPGTNPQEFLQSPGYLAFLRSLEAAAAIVTIAGPQLSPMMVRMASNPASSVMLDPEDPIAITVTQGLAEAVLGGPLAEVRRGAAGKPITVDIRLIDTPRPGRNVVAVVPGTDPAVRGQYIAVGAHNDHVGPINTPVDHDSLRAVLQVVRPQGADSPNRPPTAEEGVRIRAILDSLRSANPPRLDSIRNGADDDASGSMTVLEVAEAFALGPEKPRRSILFVWHTGEEGGLLGARHFTGHPTVPRDSIVAQLNLDMVGRGGAQDVTGESIDGALLRGGPGYVQLIGARRLSTELGDVIERVNTEAGLNLRFDYAMDANGHPQNIYCRSDHYEYAKYGIPVVFISTGGHADYHQVTDEPQYLDYARMATVAQLVHASALALANLDHRIVVDQPRPDPRAPCVQ